jgi:hypothetical protein
LSSCGTETFVERMHVFLHVNCVQGVGSTWNTTRHGNGKRTGHGKHVERRRIRTLRGTRKFVILYVSYMGVGLGMDGTFHVEHGKTQRKWK